MKDYSNKIAAYFTDLSAVISRVSVDDINTVMNLLDQARKESRNIFIMGNGGSAATSSHFAADFNKGLSEHFKDKRFKVIALNDNTPCVMAYANDNGYETIFVEQLINFYNPGDVVVGISGSGNSKNVLLAVEYANANGGVTIGITGYDGGKLKKMCKHNIHIPVDNMQITEDLHMVLDHLMFSAYQQA